jgi:hypothetical protein
MADVAAADFVPGDATGLAMPAHADALRTAGPDFLTAAFRAFGSLSPDNAVARITRCEPCHAGNSGQKLFLSVDYARPEPGLHTELFVKFSRDFVDAFRDRRRYELAAEVHLAELSRLPAFPVSVAKPYFADFHHETGTGMLIMQQVAFGEGGLEPLRHKCMDHLLPNALEHYRATVTALARLAAAHESGRLSPEIERLFPFDREAAAADLPIAWDEAQLREKIARIGEFVTGSPELFPKGVAAPAFITRMECDAVRFLQNEAAVRRFLHADDDFIALCHWNSNIDNAWFWRDADGVLHCGLLDWGMVRQMNIAYGLWGGLSAADPEMLDAHLDDLLALFMRELGNQGGPRLDAEAMRLHFDLSLMLLGLALMIDLPALVDARLPEARSASGPRDPIIATDPVVHGFLHVSTNFLHLWERRDFGASLARVLDRS